MGGREISLTVARSSLQSANRLRMPRGKIGYRAGRRKAPMPRMPQDRLPSIKVESTLCNHVKRHLIPYLSRRLPPSRDCLTGRPTETSGRSPAEIPDACCWWCSRRPSYPDRTPSHIGGGRLGEPDSTYASTTASSRSDAGVTIPIKTPSVRHRQ